jgi:hypothetical protein
MQASNSVVVTILCCVLPDCTTAQAGLSYWFTNIAVSENQRFVLVSISGNPLEDELSHAYDDFHRDEIRRIRAKYSDSGLYSNDGSVAPLWTYDGRWGSGEPIIAPDGEHVIFEGDWTSDEFGFRAVDFTRRGTTIRSYVYTEIIPQWILKAVLNGFSPPACVRTSFDPNQMTYAMRTNQGEAIVFDVKSGKVIDVRSPFSLLYGVALVALTTMFSIIIACWWRNARKARH